MARLKGNLRFTDSETLPRRCRRQDLHRSVVSLRRVQVVCAHEIVHISLQAGKVAAASILGHATLLVEKALRWSHLVKNCRTDVSSRNGGLAYENISRAMRAQDAHLRAQGCKQLGAELVQHLGLHGHVVELGARVVPGVRPHVLLH